MLHGWCIASAARRLIHAGVFLLLLTLQLKSANAQKLGFSFHKVPLQSGFRMEGYWVWCGSVIKVGEQYHMFAARWPKTGPFPEGYRTQSEIVRAVADHPLGPYQFQEVVIGERDSSFWDANMAHNPSIHKIGEKYVLFYIGSDFTTKHPESSALLRRVGYAEADAITGPWRRSSQPLIATESNNPAVLKVDSGIIMVFRDKKLQVYSAFAPKYTGPFRMTDSDLFPNTKLEDFYLFKTKKAIHLICEDNVGKVSGHERWGVHLYQPKHSKVWKPHAKKVLYNHTLLYEDGTELHAQRRERPQLLIENGRIAYLITAIYDGKNTWSQPVELKRKWKIQR